MLLIPVPAAVETGPVERKWGLGWDEGLTARLWLGGVWELGVAAGPEDFLMDSERSEYSTGYPPEWDEYQIDSLNEERRESGFVRGQVGRLLGRRGPLAAVCYLGLQYQWSDGRSVYSTEHPLDPEMDNTLSYDSDSSAWTLALGLRPSFVVLDFLTIETAFGLEYRWFKNEFVGRREFPETGELFTESEHRDGNRFDDSGWNGMASLQFFVWF
jgi:hypothetical protein